MNNSSNKRKLVLITGAGISISFNYPSTLGITTLIEKSLFADQRMNSGTKSLYNDIVGSLKNYLVNPNIYNFEDIFQAIQNIRTIQNIPSDPKAFNEFRPRIGATHMLNSRFTAYTNEQGSRLQAAYLDDLLETFLQSLRLVNKIDLLSQALNNLDKNFIVWSFTLNYDDLIDNFYNKYVTGFDTGNAPRNYNTKLLLSALDSSIPIHTHLHGSLKWGYPIDFNHDPFELHEYDTTQDGVNNSKSRPSGRPTQQGETLVPSPIITGLDKTELIFRQPFFTNFLAFFRSLHLCDTMLIAGYGLSDRHVNMGIQQCRVNRSDVVTYIVDKNVNNCPATYFNSLTPDAWHTILPGNIEEAKGVPNFPNWWLVPGIKNRRYNTAPIYLWLNGFDTFCQSVENSGLPHV